MSGTIFPSTPWFLDLWILAMGGLMSYIGCLCKAHTAFLRILSQLPPNCHYKSVFKRPFYLSIRSAALGCWETWKTSRFYDHDYGPTVLLSSLAKNWIPWSETILCDIFFMSMESGLGRSIMCKQGKSINQKKYHQHGSVVPSMKEVVLCSQPASRLLAGHLQNGIIPGISAALCYGLSRSCSQDNKSMLLRTCIPVFLPPQKAT